MSKLDLNKLDGGVKMLFDDDNFEPSIDGMQLVDIDFDGIEESAKADAIALIENLEKFYYNDNFMKQHPTFKKRIDTDLESLRILFKMRKSDETAHDLIMKAIQGNSGNASLYKSLSEMQKTIISITTKIGDIITGLNNLMKGYQLELEFNISENDEIEKDENENLTQTSRGSKEFIEKMNRDVEQVLFEDIEEEEAD